MPNDFRDETVTIPMLTALKIELVYELLQIAQSYAKSGVPQSLLVPVLTKAIDAAEEIQDAIAHQLAPATMPTLILTKWFQPRGQTALTYQNQIGEGTLDELKELGEKHCDFGKLIYEEWAEGENNGEVIHVMQAQDALENFVVIISTQAYLDSIQNKDQQ